MEHSKRIVWPLLSSLRLDGKLSWRSPLVWLVAAGATLPVLGWTAWAGWNTFYKRGRKLPFDSTGLTRPLSDVEQWYSMRNIADILPNISLTLLVSGPVWTRQEVERRARVAMLNHAPSMCTIVDPDQPNFQAHWKRLWSTDYAPDQQGIVDVTEEVRESDSEDDTTWRAVWERMERAGFHPTEQPRHTLFKIAIVSRPSSSHWELVIFVHHSVFDVYGTQMFLKAMLNASPVEAADALLTQEETVMTRNVTLEKSGASAASGTVAELMNLRFEGDGRKPGASFDVQVKWPKVLEHLLNANLNFNLWSKILLPYYAPVVRKLFPWYYRGQPSKVWCGPVNREGVILSNPTTGQLWIKVTADDLARLHKNGKARGVTINSALWSAAMFALLQMHFEISVRPNSEAQSGAHPWSAAPEDPASQSARSASAYSSQNPLVMALQNPVDYRKFCSPDQSDNWSPLVGAVHTEFALSKDAGFWEVAAQMQQQLKDKTGEALAQLGFIKHVPAPRARWVLSKDAIGHNGRITTMGITNGGRVDFEPAMEKAGLKLRDVWFARQGMRDGTLFSVHVLTPGSARDMNLMIIYAKELVDDKDATRLTETLLSVIRKAGEGNSSNDFSASYLLDSQKAQ